MEMPSLHPRPSEDREREKIDLNESLAMTAVIHGTVQGVGFRYWAWRHAEKLGLVGHATNNSDGTVTIEVEGPRWALQELLKSLNSSDTPGVVMTVDAHYGPATGRFSEFTRN